MASSKVAGSKLAKDRQAALLALADSIGDAKAAARFGIRSPTTVRSYRRALTTDDELCGLYEAAKARQDAIDDRVVEAQANAEVEVWGAIKHTAALLRDASEPASPEYLEALAKVIEACSKSSDQRAEVDLTRKMLERAGNSGSNPKDTARPAKGGSDPKVPATGVSAAGAVH